MKTFIIFIAAFVLGTSAIAQTKFIGSGKIEFEKKVNMHKQMGEGYWSEEFRSRMPVYRTSYSDLIFDEHQSLYKAGREVEDKYKNFWSAGSEEDLIYNNFDSGQTTATRQVFEKKFLMQDSMQPIEWRITGDSRTIAGFDCKKAVGKLYDSLYVVAFYTDQIVVPGGPSIYQGLPGMILGLAFPRFYTTFFATKVTLDNPKPNELVQPTKGKKTNRSDLFKQVREVFSKDRSENDWQKYFWQAVL